ncbi:hypothetical protein BC826DRAFT_1110004 [Russula brevipes]|nr:hypothetical protein BC826DRAFT_1110004 [Russula brevipes]
MVEITDTSDCNGSVSGELYDLDEVLAMEIHWQDIEGYSPVANAPTPLLAASACPQYYYQSSTEDDRLIGKLRSMLMEGKENGKMLNAS